MGIETAACRHRWCVRETVTGAGAAAARFHHGRPRSIRAGDDTLIVATVATEDSDTIYVEVSACISGRPLGDLPMWLTSGEAGDVAAALAAAVADLG